MKSIFSACLLAVAASAMSDKELKFINFMMKHGKSYASAVEFGMRMAIWERNDEEIAAYNATHDYAEIEHNFTSDMQEEEK